MSRIAKKPINKKRGAPRMRSHIELEIKRREEERTQFYRGSIGTKMRKRRIELKLTQEDLGKGIISNTFVSKLENNVIHPNKESLLLLMERLDLPKETIDLPEEMLKLLDRAVESFYWNSIEKYEEIMKECLTGDFAVLIQITRLGYHVLLNENEQATKIQNELYRYLTSMENHVFSIFLLFGMANLIQNHNYFNAVIYRNALQNMMFGDERIVGLEKYYESVLFGKCGSARKSAESAAIAEQMFLQKGNIARVMLIDVDRYEFSLIENGDFHAEYHSENHILLSRYDIDRLHVLRALSGENPQFFLGKVEKDSPFYPFTIFVKCQLFHKEKNQNEYEKAKAILCQNRDQCAGSMDWYEILERREKNDLWEYQAYLSQFVLPIALRTQNILLIKIVSKEISTILADRKRYRDAYFCERDCTRNLERIKKNLHRDEDE
jgi:transcriptional regulator with XRE-family HTH domain